MPSTWAPEPGLARDLDAFIASAPRVPWAAALDDHVRALAAYQQALHDAGLAVVSWPTALGGRGLGARASAYVARRLGEARMPELINFVGIDVLAPAMMRFVDPDRLARWLPPMARADEIWCQLFSEPDAGSDLAALATRAVPDRDGWRVTGNKVWSTWGQFARWGFLLARTGTPDSRHRGITAFVVDMTAPGIETRPLRTLTGEAEFAEVYMDGVAVGPDAVIGQVDRGWDVTLHILGSERGPYAVRRASLLRGMLGEVLAQAEGAELPSATRIPVVQAVIAMRLLDLRIEEVVDALERGDTPGADAALTKMRITDAEQQIAEAWHRVVGLEAVAWHGETIHPATSAFLYSRGASIYGGTAQIQRNVIGERLLGLPREPAI